MDYSTPTPKPPPMLRTSAGIARWKVRLKKVPGLLPLAWLCRIMVDPHYRSEWLLTRDRPDNLFQSTSYTKYNRFPRIFSFVREQFSDVADTCILSYGCSTGEEVFTLRRYFPLAEIVGIDINPYNIAVCRKRLGKISDPRIRFKLSGSPEDEPDSCYNAIFCMAVLRNGKLGADTPETCDHLIRFSDFEKTVSELCRSLKPGGYLVIRGSNFRFADTAAASGFDAVFSVKEKTQRADTPLYGPDNRWLANAVYNEVIFRKRGNT